MFFYVLAAAAFTGMVMTSTSCAQREQDPDRQSEVIVVSEGKRAWLGVAVEDMTGRLARRMNVKTERGALVNSVSDDSPAEKAGIKEDDIIIEFDGKGITDARDLTRAVQKAEPGKSVACVVMRRSDKKTIQVTVGTPPGKAMAWTARTPRAPMAPVEPGHIKIMRGGFFGLSVMDLNRQLAEYFEVPGGRGVLVTEVKKDGTGFKAGMKAGDVIVNLGTTDVDDIGDLQWALDDRDEGDTVTVGYIRKGARRSTTVTVDEGSTTRIYRFKSHGSPHFDFEFDLDGLNDMQLDLERNRLEIQRELERAEKEAQAAGREAKRQAEKAVREYRRQVLARTI